MIDDRKSTDNRWGLLVLLIGYVLFLSFGSIVGSISETPYVEALISTIQETRVNFLKNNTCVNVEELEELLNVAVFANSRGVSPLSTVNNNYIWCFGDGVFFAVVFLLTIGYGHLGLLGNFSKVFFVIYGAFGIPFTLSVINALVFEISKLSNYILTKLNLHWGHIYQPLKIKVLHLALMFTLVVLTVVVIPGIVFTKMEADWTFLDSVYFIFVSLTTIGLGDYVPTDGVDKSHYSLYRIVLAVYLIFGMVGTMLILTIFYDIPQLHSLNILYHSDFSETPEQMGLAKEPTNLRSYTKLSEYDDTKNLPPKKTEYYSSLSKSRLQQIPISRNERPIYLQTKPRRRNDCDEDSNVTYDDDDVIPIYSSSSNCD